MTYHPPYIDDQDTAEALSYALERYTCRAWATHVVPSHGSHPTRILVSPETHGLTEPTKVFVVTVTPAAEIRTEDEWRTLARANGFPLQATEIARSLGLTDPEDNRHQWDAEQPAAQPEGDQS